MFFSNFLGEAFFTGLELEGLNEGKDLCSDLVLVDLQDKNMKYR